MWFAPINQTEKPQFTSARFRAERANRRCDVHKAICIYQQTDRVPVPMMVISEECGAPVITGLPATLILSAIQPRGLPQVATEELMKTLFWAAIMAVLLSAGVAIGVPSANAREVVRFEGYMPGTVVVKTRERRLYYVTGNGKAIRYPVGVGRAGKAWTGSTLSPACG